MPKLLRARPPLDDDEERQVRRLARARHAPGDRITRARTVVGSWEGKRVAAIATELRCHPQTVRERLARFDAEGLDGLGDRPGSGRRPRLTEVEGSRIVALVAQPPPGRTVRQPDGTLEATDEHKEPHWTLDALAAAAREPGVEVRRSQVRRILAAEGVRWRRPRSWARSVDPDFVPKGRRSSGSPPPRRPARRSSAPTSWAP